MSAESLVEPVDISAADAETVVDDIHYSARELWSNCAAVVIGDGESTWVLVADAVRRGIDRRVGFEDTLYTPDRERAASNSALIRAAREFGAGTGGS